MPWTFRVCDSLGLGQEQEGAIDDLCRFTENFADRFIPNPVSTIKNIVNTISDAVDILVEQTSDCDTLYDRGDSCPAINFPDGTTPPSPKPTSTPTPDATPTPTKPSNNPLPKPSNPPYPIYEPEDEYQPVDVPDPVPIPVLPPNRKQKDKETSTTVTETLNKRKFGCLLHEPITSSPVKIRVCIEPTEVEILLGDVAQSNAVDTYIAWQAKKKGLALPQEILEDPNIDFSDLGLIYWRNYGLSAHAVPTYQMLFGRKSIAGLAMYYNRQNIAGVFQIRSMISESVEVEICNVSNLPEDQPFNTTLGDCGGDDGCFIPVRNFKENHSLGYKRQLQIIFKATIDKKRITKEITIPDPRDDLTAEEILNTIKSCNLYNDDGLEFGDQCQAEQDTKSETIKGYYRVYLMADDVERAKNNAADLFLKLNQLSKCSLEKEPRVSFKDYSEYIKHTGRFKPYVGYIFNFRNDGNEPDCVRFDLRE